MRRARLVLPIAVAAGASSALAYAPFDLFPLVALSWGALWWLLDEERSGRRAFALGFAWGIGAFFAGLCWLYVALNVYGGMAPPLAVIAVLLFCAYLALYPALAALLMYRLRSGRPVFDAALVAACWTLGEWLRGMVFTGFPWLAIGYTQTPPSPLAGWAPLLGVYGVGFLLVLCVALAGHALRRRLKPWMAVAGIGLVLGGGAALRAVSWTAPVGEPLDLVLMQTNIAQDQKWDPARVDDWLRLNLQLVRDNPARLVVLPETTLPMLDTHLPEGYLQALAQAAGGDVVLGIFTRDDAGRIYNSAISRGVSPAQRYGKNHLVPFGEFSPPLFGWFYELASIPMSDQTRGGANQPPLRIAGQTIAVNICYEDVFGEELLYALPQATMLLNMSNLAWYGDSHAQPQHLQISRMRALETGRPMLRATNTGMTAVVQPDGQVSHVAPAFQRMALRLQQRGYQGMTPYAWWGNVPVLLLIALVLALRKFFGRRSSLP